MFSGVGAHTHTYTHKYTHTLIRRVCWCAPDFIKVEGMLSMSGLEQPLQEWSGTLEVDLHRLL